MSATLTESNLRANATTEIGEQYSLAKILGIWASIALPMGLIHWVVSPTLIPRVNMEPGFLYLILITLGLVWEGVVAYMILRREVKPFTWANIKDRVWLHTPTNSKTGIPSNWLLLWTIPLIVVIQLGDQFLDPLDGFWVKTFPFLAPPPYMEIERLAGPAVGQWWLLGVVAVIILFNYLVGEELIFRGILLPKMNGVFGKWDFIANGILFVAYHLHMAWKWPSMLLYNWIRPWATKRFKSYWVAFMLHGFVDSIFLIIPFTMAIKGLI